MTGATSARKTRKRDPIDAQEDPGNILGWLLFPASDGGANSPSDTCIVSRGSANYRRGFPLSLKGEWEHGATPPSSSAQPPQDHLLLSVGPR